MRSTHAQTTRASETQKQQYSKDKSAVGCMLHTPYFYSRKRFSRYQCLLTHAYIQPRPGDSWTPSPDAWQPDDAPAASPHDTPASGFDFGEGFPDSTAASAVDAAAAAPDVVTAVTATGLSAADLSMYPHHIFMQIIE